MWFKADDKLHSNRKTRQAGTAAMGLWVILGTWCADNGTDGFAPRFEVKKWDSRFRLASKLVDSGLWMLSSEAGEAGYRFHDWCDYQPSAVQIEQRRERERERMRSKRSVNGYEVDGKNDSSVPDSRAAVTLNEHHLSADCLHSVTDLSEKFPKVGNYLADQIGHKSSSEGMSTEFVAANIFFPEPEPEPEPLQEISPIVAISSAPQAAPDAPTKTNSHLRGHRLPDNWQPPLALKTKLETKFPHVDLDDELEMFKNYWLALPGAKALKLDWNRTFSNRVAEVAKRSSSRQKPHATTSVNTLDLNSSSGKQQLIAELSKDEPDPEKMRSYGMTQDQIHSVLERKAYEKQRDHSPYRGGLRVINDATNHILEP